MSAIVKAEPPAPAPHAGAAALMPQNMEQAMRLAEMMARGKMLPAHFHNSPGDCLLVVEQAMRWRMSPFAVAQCTASIKGKLMFEGKLVAAAIEESGAIVGSLDYTFSGEGMGRKITVSATRRGDGTPRTVEVALKDAMTENGVWKKQPDQQLVYHGARVWGRRWTPGVILGVYSREEFNREGEAEDGTTIEGTATSAPAAIAAPKPPAAHAQTIGEFLDALQAELSLGDTSAAVEAIIAGPQVQKALARLQNGALERLHGILDAARARVAIPPVAEVSKPDELDEWLLPRDTQPARMET